MRSELRVTALFFLLLAAGLGSTTAQAIDPCAAAGNQTDAFKGDQIVKIETAVHSVTVTKDSAAFGLMVYVPAMSTDRLPPGFKLQMLLANGTKVTFTSDTPADPAQGAYASEYSTHVATTWMLHLPLSIEAINAIAQSPPTAMEYEISGEQTITLSKDNGRMYQRDFACAANHFPGNEPAAPAPAPEKKSEE